MQPEDRERKIAQWSQKLADASGDHPAGGERRVEFPYVPDIAALLTLLEKAVEDLVRMLRGG